MAKDWAQIFKKENNPERVRYRAVRGIFKNGIKNRYERNLQSWYLNHSTEIRIDGDLIGEHDVYDSSTANTIETNKIDLYGIPLTEIDFIEIGLKQSKQIFDKTLGSELNRDVHNEAKAYIEYLEQRKTEISGTGVGSGVNITGFQSSLEKSTKLDLYNQLKKGLYVECTEADFLAMFTDNPKPIKWKKSNALLSFFVNDVFMAKNDYYWDIAQKIFINPKTGDFYGSLRQSHRTAYNGKTKEPRGWQTLLNTYKHLL